MASRGSQQSRSNQRGVNGSQIYIKRRGTNGSKTICSGGDNGDKPTTASAYPKWVETEFYTSPYAFA